MGIYESAILPRATHWICSRNPFVQQRKKILGAAGGVVLEIGAGSGLNFPHYIPQQIEHLIALEPAKPMHPRAQQALEHVQYSAEILTASGEDVPMEDNSIDTAVFTYVLCTIPDPLRALREAARLLRPGGRLLFSEHGKASDPRVASTQTRFNGVWSALAGGCNLNRDVPTLLAAAGFHSADLAHGYIPGPRFLSYNYWGSAVAQSG